MADTKNPSNQDQSISVPEWLKRAIWEPMVAQPIAGVYQIATHPKQTAEYFGALSEAYASKVARAQESQQYLDYPETPVPVKNPLYNPKANPNRPRTAQEVNVERPLDAMGEAIAKPWTSFQSFGQTVKTDPGYFTTALQALIPGLGELAPESAAGNALRLAGKVINPVPTAAGTVVKKATPALIATVKNASKIPNQILSAKTGVPSPLIKEAYNIGKNKGTPPPGKGTPPPGVETPDQSYNRFASGGGSPAETKKLIQSAINEKTKSGIAALRAGKKTIAGNVDFDPINKAFNDAYSDAIKGSGVSGLTPGQIDAFDKAGNMIADTFGSGDHGVENVDGLKRQLYANANTLKDSDPAAANIFHSVRAAVDQSIRTVNPAYAELMDTAQAGINAVKDLSATTGATGASSTASVAKTLKAISGPGGESLLDDLSKIEPRIPAQLAGSVAASLKPIGKAATTAALVSPFIEGGAAAIAQNLAKIPLQVWRLWPLFLSTCCHPLPQ